MDQKVEVLRIILNPISWFDLQVFFAENVYFLEKIVSFVAFEHIFYIFTSHIFFSLNMYDNLTSYR